MSKIKPIEIKGIEELAAKLKHLPEKIKRREVVRILRTQSRPLVWRARTIAYRGSKETKSAGTSQIRKGTVTKNMFSSIGAWPNKGLTNDKHYIVTGYKSYRKKGALYMGWQSEGISTTDKKGPRKGRGFSYPAKNIMGETDKQLGEQAAKKAARALDKMFQKIMAQSFPPV